MKVYTAEQMRESERLAVERGSSYRQLMVTPAAPLRKTFCAAIPKAAAR